jgi:hypothetical protein
MRLEEVGMSFDTLTRKREADWVFLAGVRVSRSSCSPIKASSIYNVLEASVGGLSEAVNRRRDGTHVRQNFYVTSGNFLRSVSDNLTSSL